MSDDCVRSENEKVSSENDYVPSTNDIITTMERLTINEANDVRDMKIRLAKKFADANISSELASFQENITPNANMYDIAMLKLGKIINDKLVVDLIVFKITIDLPALISESIKYSRTNIIYDLIENNVNIYQLQPLIMVMCIQMNQFELLSKLIDMKIPLDTMNYRTVYHLAKKGKLDLLKKITENYEFDNVSEIVGKICVEAIIENHLDILEYYCPKKIYESAPDIMQTYLYNSIIHGGHIGVVKHFISMGCNIKMDSMQAVNIAIAHNRGNILKYFTEIDAMLLQILPEDIKKRFCLVQLETKMLEITDGIKSCNIYHSNIETGDYYYKCSLEKSHYYCKLAWESWTTKRSDWKCLVCQNNVDTILYKNTNDKNY